MANKKPYPLTPRPCPTCNSLFVAKYATYCGTGCRSHLNGFYKHGFAKRNKKTPEYICYEKIKSRCYSKTAKDYKHYGGRGIKVCDRWLNSFESFLDDMGNRPSSKHSIDRIDVNGNYELSNCRWATQDVQMQNTSRKHKHGYRGVYKKMLKGVWNGYYEVVISTKYLGFTRNIKEAAEIYDKAALIKYKEFANLNFPEKKESYLKELFNAVL
jgi:hypothetical protein